MKKYFIYLILLTIAASNSSAAESAKGILTLVKGISFDINIERKVDNNGLGKMAKTNITNTKINDQTNNSLNVYPNPSNGIINIIYTVDELTENTTISLLDILGKQLFIQKVIEKNGTLQFDATKFNSGFYFVHLSNGKTINNNSKIIITH